MTYSDNSTGPGGVDGKTRSGGFQPLCHGQFRENEFIARLPQQVLMKYFLIVPLPYPSSNSGYLTWDLLALYCSELYYFSHPFFLFSIF